MKKSSLHGDNQQITKLQIGWLAGIIDGDGCITIRRNGRYGGHNYQGNWRITTFRPTITIANSNPLIIEETSNILDQIKVGYNIQQREINRKTHWTIHITGFKRCKALLDKIKNHLIGKKSQANLMNKFYKTRLAKRKLSVEDKRYDEEDIKIANQLRNLNDYTRNTKGNLVKI